MKRTVQCEAGIVPQLNRDVPLSPRCQRRTSNPERICFQHLRSGEGVGWVRWVRPDDPGRYYR